MLRERVQSTHAQHMQQRPCQWPRQWAMEKTGTATQWQRRPTHWEIGGITVSTTRRWWERVRSSSQLLRLSPSQDQKPNRSTPPMPKCQHSENCLISAPATSAARVAPLIKVGTTAPATMKTYAWQFWKTPRKLYTATSDARASTAKIRVSRSTKKVQQCSAHRESATPVRRSIKQHRTPKWLKCEQCHQTDWGKTHVCTRQGGHPEFQLTGTDRKRGNSIKAGMALKVKRSLFVKPVSSYCWRSFKAVEQKRPKDPMRPVAAHLN